MHVREKSSHLLTNALIARRYDVLETYQWNSIFTDAKLKKTKQKQKLKPKTWSLDMFPLHKNCREIKFQLTEGSSRGVCGCQITSALARIPQFTRNVISQRVSSKVMWLLFLRKMWTLRDVPATLICWRGGTGGLAVYRLVTTNTNTGRCTCTNTQVFTSVRLCVRSYSHGKKEKMYYSRAHATPSASLVGSRADREKFHFVLTIINWIRQTS